ncbi:hypothetical protein B0H17DRAFT_1339896, partial [Mycena rosella]
RACSPSVRRRAIRLILSTPPRNLSPRPFVRTWSPWSNASCTPPRPLRTYAHVRAPIRPLAARTRAESRSHAGHQPRPLPRPLPPPASRSSLRSPEHHPSRTGAPSSSHVHPRAPQLFCLPLVAALHGEDAAHHRPGPGARSPAPRPCTSASPSRPQPTFPVRPRALPAAASRERCGVHAHTRTSRSRADPRLSARAAPRRRRAPQPRVRPVSSCAPIVRAHHQPTSPVRSCAFAHPVVAASSGARLVVCGGRRDRVVCAARRA